MAAPATISGKVSIPSRWAEIAYEVTPATIIVPLPMKVKRIYTIFRRVVGEISVIM